LVQVKKDERRVAEMKKLKKFFKAEDGATAIEYGLIAALISVVIIVAITLVGTNLTAVFNAIAAAL
jgi:pilus assembly protein Flp/PilA